MRELTDGKGVNAVFDSVGKTAFDASLDSLDSLARQGLMMWVGTASGPVAPFDPQLLVKKGPLYLTRPALADYIADPAEKNALADAPDAHRDLEARKTTGSSVFVV